MQGRPSSFNQQIADTICERLADGESLRTICQSEEMPHRATVFRWLADEARKDFRDQYARAREAQADLLVDELRDIADTPQLGTKTVSKATGTEITEADMIEHRRLQVDARKWLAGKLAPKKYGDKMDVEHGGSVGVTVEIVRFGTGSSE